MTLKTILAALGIAAVVAASVPMTAQAEGMHRNMRRQMMMSRMHHHRMHMMMHHHRHHRY